MNRKRKGGRGRLYKEFYLLGAAAWGRRRRTFSTIQNGMHNNAGKQAVFFHSRIVYSFFYLLTYWIGLDWIFLYIGCMVQDSTCLYRERDARRVCAEGDVGVGVGVVIYICVMGR
jgi:hypothetical protein